MGVATKKLTVAEFLVQDPSDELQRYELQDGEVIALNAPKPKHSGLQTVLAGVLSFYQLRRPEFRPVVEPRLALGEITTRRPDLIVMLDPQRGGRCREEEQCFSGPPEIIVEVLSSKPLQDLVTKRELYAEVGIPEYWVLSPDEEEALFLRLAGGHYERVGLMRQGVYETPVLPGFRLDVGALFRGDLAVLAAGLDA